MQIFQAQRERSRYDISNISFHLNKNYTFTHVYLQDTSILRPCLPWSLSGLPVALNAYEDIEEMEEIKMFQDFTIPDNIITSIWPNIHLGSSLTIKTDLIRRLTLSTIKAPCYTIALQTQEKRHPSTLICNVY
jgi:hypothetical protein